LHVLVFGNVLGIIVVDKLEMADRPVNSDYSYRETQTNEQSPLPRGFSHRGEENMEYAAPESKRGLPETEGQTVSFSAVSFITATVAASPAELKRRGQPAEVSAPSSRADQIRW
jgi:hypothetical protein